MFSKHKRGGRGDSEDFVRGEGSVLFMYHIGKPCVYSKSLKHTLYKNVKIASLVTYECTLPFCITIEIQDYVRKNKNSLFRMIQYSCGESSESECLIYLCFNLDNKTNL